MKTLARLFLISHGVPVGIKSDDAMAYYKAIARIHGLSLVRCGRRFRMV